MAARRKNGGAIPLCAKGCATTVPVFSGITVFCLTDRYSEIRLDFSLAIEEENGSKWVGDRLLVKRDRPYGDPAFDHEGETYYYVLDYSRVKNEREAMSIIQTL